MAETFEILDTVLHSDNCPLGVEDVYEQEYFKKHSAATGNEDEFEENKPPSICEMEHKDQLKWAMKVLKANNAKPKHGDVIWIGGDTYRNMGIHFWDAKNNKIIPMATKICDYGHVPKRFAVGKAEGEFSSTHWNGISYYNNLEPYWSSKKKGWIYPSECAYESDSE